MPAGDQPDIDRVDVSSSDADLHRLSPPPAGANIGRPAKDFVDLADNPSVIKVVVHVPDAYTSNYLYGREHPFVDADGSRSVARPSQAEQQRLDALLATLDGS